MYMKWLFFIIVTFVLTIETFAQAPQFAVVRPDGTSYICPSFDSAYNKSVNGDNIYLPGGSFTVTNPISKSLHIYGTGYNQDSSNATGITSLNSITISAGAENGSIEGIYFVAGTNNLNPSINFFMTNSVNPIQNYTISSCYITYGINITPTSNGTSCSSFTIKDNYVGNFLPSQGPPYSASGINGNLINSVISNNITTGALGIGVGNVFSNNIFFQLYLSSNNCSYYNNIYGEVFYSNCNNSFFNNNMNIININGSNGNTGTANVSEYWSLIFINSNMGDFHVKTTSLAHNSGTDGTDRGIYGGLFPWKEGSVPSDPHIYYKQIAPQTSQDGKINIRVKVRTNN